MNRTLSSLLMVGFLFCQPFSKSLASEKNVVPLLNNWLIQSAAKAGGDAEEVSRASFQPKDYYKASVPSTVFGTLFKNGLYNDLFRGKNLENLPGTELERFKGPWIFRTSFNVPKTTAYNCCILEFDGIIYRADIWMNGHKIADSSEVFGAYRRFQFRVQNFLNKSGENVLAVKIYPSRPGDFSVGFVDWNPGAPDRSMGLWREVRLRFVKDVSINFPFVKTELNTKTLNEAKLSVSAELKNETTQNIKGSLEGRIGKIAFSKNVSLLAGEQRLVEFSPTEFRQLIIKNPKLWWTKDLGKPNLYSLSLSFKEGANVSDECRTDFGIREIKALKNAKGQSCYSLNGKKILIRGGGWTDDIFLDYDPEKLENQIKYVQHMNLNTIRLEGIWGNNSKLFDLCDRYGIMVMCGWSCQWEWPLSLGKKCDPKYGGIQTDEDINTVSKYWEDQVKWLRNHPSLSVWLVGSDLMPSPRLEKEYINIFKKFDPTRPYLASAKGLTSSLSGPTGVKMLGPYDYVPPRYWYSDTTSGGAYGFNTETGPGPQVPPLESLLKMMPKDSLWPINTMWNAHCSKNMFTNLNRYNSALYARLGEAGSVEEYCRKAQFMNYEAMRPMFESFAEMRYGSTGVIQWMLNSAWPKLWWQLYDYYLMPNGAFYGAKKACEPLHIQYNYDKKTLSVINMTMESRKDLKTETRIYSTDMKELFNKTQTLDILGDETRIIESLPDSIPGLTMTYLLDLRLKDHDGKTMGINQYWLSKKEDQLSQKETTWYTTPMSGYADLKALNFLPKARISERHSLNETGELENLKIDIENKTDRIAAFLEIRVLKGNTDESVLPVFLDDNYFSMLPREKRSINCYFYKKNLEGKKPRILISGFNTNSLEKK